MKKTIMRRVLVLCSVLCCISGRVHADPNVYDYAVPTSVHHLQATAKTLSANVDVLKQISSDFADAYRLKEATYSFTAPDRLEYKTHVGILTVTYTTTNTERTVTSNFFIHSNTDISRDSTKRNTLQVLGLLPQNYLDTMHVDYVGSDTVNGISTQVFVMRYINDPITAFRRFEFWIDPEKHYIVQKRVWDSHDRQRETIIYSNPQQVLPGFWMPTIAEAYSPSMQLGGTVGYENISAD